jgi:hypothetical protein
MSIRTLFTIGILAGAGGVFAAACTDAPTTPASEQLPTVGTPQFAVTTLGQCMGDDAYAGGLTSGMGSATDINCTANDIYLARAVPTRYATMDPGDDPAAGAPLAPNQAIPCSAGETFWVYTSAEVANNAQQRWDIGVWIASDGGNQAITGSCDHFILPLPPYPGVSDFDDDYCGDMAAAKQGGDAVTELNLEWVEVQCTVTKVVDGMGYAEVGACVGWQNSANKNVADRYCPFPAEGGTEYDWRAATTPETKAKCNCDPLLIRVDPQGTLTIEKETVGGDYSFAFTGNAANLMAFNLMNGQSRTSDPISAGTYTVTETVPTGWDLTNRSCWLTNDPATPKAFTSVANGVSVALGAGEHVTCKFTNTKRADVTIRKVTIPAEVPAVGSFTFSQDFDGTGNFNLGHNGQKLFENIVPGVAKTVVESDPTPAYDLTAIDCTGASVYTGTVGTRTLSVTPQPGEVITCTFTNTARKPKLTLVKVVNNQYGGTATAADFQARINGANVPWGVAQVLDPGSYTASEQFTITGYTAGPWTGDCAANGTVTLALGDDKTCTITNSDVQPKLRLIKTVVNDNGGTLTVADFPLFVNATAVLSGAWNGFNAGTYTASETEQPGYAAGPWGGDCATNGSVTLVVGDEKTCTITNNDIAPTLTLYKIVEGGTATAADFQARINGAAVPWAVAQTLNAGAYTASEDVFAGYEAGLWTGDCAPDGSVTLGLADNKSCTITNTAIPEDVYGCTPGFWGNPVGMTWWTELYDAAAPGGLWLPATHLVKQMFTSAPNNIVGNSTLAVALSGYLGVAPPANTLDGAKANLARQAVAGYFNELQFGDVYPAPSLAELRDAVNAMMASSVRSDILRLAGVIDAFNNGYLVEYGVPGDLLTASVMLDEWGQKIPDPGYDNCYYTEANM